MKLRLFHKIGVDGSESADVRQFLVDNALTDLVEFSNVTYAEAHAQLLALTGNDFAPVLVAENRVVSGKAAIIDWLKTNILCLRD